MGVPDPWPTISIGIHSPGPLTMSKHAKTLCPGWEVATFREAEKRERQGDTLTCKQSSLRTVGKSWVSPYCHHQCQETALRSFAELIRLRHIKRWQSRSSPAVAREDRSPPWRSDGRHQQWGEKTVQMAFISRSERWQSGLWSFADLIRFSSSECGSPDLGRSNCPWTWSDSAVVRVAVHIEISQLLSMSFVYLSKCHPVTLSLLLHQPSNLLTWTQSFCMLACDAKGSGEWIPLEKVGLWVQILEWKCQAVSSTFTP